MRWLLPLLVVLVGCVATLPGDPADASPAQ